MALIALSPNSCLRDFKAWRLYALSFILQELMALNALSPKSCQKMFLASRLVALSFCWLRFSEAGTATLPGVVDFPC